MADNSNDNQPSNPSKTGNHTEYRTYSQVTSGNSEDNPPTELPSSDVSQNENSEANVSQNENSQNQKKSENPTYQGKRPFCGAVDIYSSQLDESVEKAIAQLESNPDLDYAPVHMNLFGTVMVKCDNGEEKPFTLHEVHYGPEVSRQTKLPYESDMDFQWRRFQNRYQYMWVIIDQENRGGDGTGKNGTACSPFRMKQISLLKSDTKYFLTDTSQICFNRKTNKLGYSIQIRLYRNAPEVPIPCWHGYGHIPGLGAVSMEKKVQHYGNSQMQSVQYVNMNP